MLTPKAARASVSEASLPGRFSIRTTNSVMYSTLRQLGGHVPEERVGRLNPSPARQVAVPDQPGGYGPHRAPWRGEDLQLLRAGDRPEPERLHHTDLKGPVPGGEDVWQPKSGKEIGVGGPRPDPLDRHQLRS